MPQIKQNYFELFGIPESFNLVQPQLAEKYRALQTEWHPDRFAGAGEQQRLRAVQMSSYLNQAFDTLRAPLSRAGYLLKLKGYDIEQVTQQDLGMDLLMEQMQLREALEELPGDESALDALETLKSEVGQKLVQCQNRFSAQFERDAFGEAKKTFHELQFLVKLLKEVEIGEEQRLGY